MITGSTENQVDDVGDIDLEDAHAPELGENIEMQEFREPLLQLNGQGGQTIRSTGNRTPLGRKCAGS